MEIWKPVPGHDGYEASTLGRIRSIYAVNGNGRLRAAPLILKARTNKYGYERVHLGNRWRDRMVHRLVLETFAGPPPNGHQACHNNGLRSDNRRANLRWGTPQANSDDRLVHGTMPRKLTGAVVQQIRAHRGWLTQGHLAEIFGIARSQVSRIMAGHQWQHLKHVGTP